MREIRNLSIIALVLVLFSACSVNKFIPDDAALYSESTIEFSNVEKPIRKQETLESDIQTALYVKPNNKLLGLWMTRLWIYYQFQDRKEKGIGKYLYKTFSEEPIYLKDLDTILLKNIVAKQMQDHGYFFTDISVSHSVDKKRATVNYDITPGPVTTIDSIQRPLPINPVDSICYHYKGYWLELDEPYLLNDFKEERTRLATHIRSLGYFDFDANDIYYLVDTSDLKNSVSVYMRTKKPANDTIHRKYYIKDVNIYVKGFRGSSDAASSNKNTYTYRNYTISDPLEYIDRHTLERNLLIEEGSIFSVKDYELTLSRLLNLNVFQYVNMEYEKVDKDSLDVNIFLTPKNNIGLQYSIEANTSDRSFLGSNISATFYNNNALNRAERLSGGIAFGSEFQLINNKVILSILNLNAQAKYEIPRILFPFKTSKSRSKIPPKTYISVQEDFQLWLQYFTKNSVNATFGYEWERKPRQLNTFDLLFINLNNVFSTSVEFDSIIANRPLLGLSFQDNVIIGSLFAYQYSSNKRRSFGNHFNYRASIETAGNTANLISPLFTNSSNPEIFGVPIAQYIKLDFDFRFTRGFNEKSSLVTRLSTGIVDPYGSSDIAPFTKQYFLGGPTTLRGFQYRSVGPGSYQGATTSGIVNPIDQAGDIKLLLNVEYRFPIYSIVRGATFLDAGNVWLLRSDVSRPEGVFQFDQFYKQIAFNTGFGLRFDLDYFAIRIDLGVPLFEPYKDNGSRWIWNNGPGSFGDFYSDYLVLSGGIGYPF